MERKWFKRVDVLIICGLLVISGVILILLSLFRSDSNLVSAVIINDDKEVMQIKLDTANDEIFTLLQNENVSFQIEGSKIRFVNVNCPDKLCENFGYLSKPGDMAICLPNKVILRLVGEEKNDIDAIVN